MSPFIALVMYLKTVSGQKHIRISKHLKIQVTISVDCTHAHVDPTSASATNVTIADTVLK